MHPEAREELRVRFKLAVLEYATHVGVTKSCQAFRSSYGIRNFFPMSELDVGQKLGV